MKFLQCEIVSDEIHCSDGHNVYRYYYPQCIIQSGSWARQDNTDTIIQCTNALYAYYIDNGAMSNINSATVIFTKSYQSANGLYTQYYDEASKLIYRWYNGWKTPCTSHEHDIELSIEQIKKVNLARIRFEYHIIIDWVIKLLNTLQYIPILYEVGDTIPQYIIAMIINRAINDNPISCRVSDTLDIIDDSQSDIEVI